MAEQKFPLKPKLDKNAIPVILWNLVPFAGVLFLHWKPESVFVCYALETIVVGFFNVFRLVAVYYYGLPPKPDETGVKGLGIIPFFLFHYYFFVFVQLSIFFPTYREGISVLTDSNYYTALGAFIINCALNFINDFMLGAKYTQRTMSEQMFEPYPRIFVQQFVVILGGFIFSVSGNGYPVLIIFVAVKIYLDLLLKDLDIATLSNMMKRKVENSA